jgi:DNA-binding transcriptional LysR family regulator
MVWQRGFDLRSMSVFLAVADAESMVSAARSLGMTQAGVSQYISKLEDVLGTRLVDRNLRPVRLTPAGALLQERVRHVLTLAEDARLAVTDLGEATLPELRMSIINSLAGSVLPEVYDRIQDRFRFKTFSMQSGMSGKLNEALLNRDFDVIVTSDSMDNVGGLERFDLVREPYILVMPRDQNAEELSLNELAQKMLYVRYSEHTIMGRHIEQHLRRLRFNLPHIAEFDSHWSVGAMVSAGRGWAIMTPLSLLDGQVDPASVICRPLHVTQLTRRLTLVARKGELANMPQELAGMFRDVLHRIVEEQIVDYGGWLAAECEILTPSR